MSCHTPLYHLSHPSRGFYLSSRTCSLSIEKGRKQSKLRIDLLPTLLVAIRYFMTPKETVSFSPTQVDLMSPDGSRNRLMPTMQQVYQQPTATLPRGLLQLANIRCHRQRNKALIPSLVITHPSQGNTLPLPGLSSPLFDWFKVRAPCR